MSPRARRVLIGLAVFVLLALAAFAWFIWFGPGRRGPRPPSTYGIHEPHPGDLQAGLDLMDNVRNYGLPQDLPYRFRTNALGFRGAPVSADATPSVLVLGDSFVFGMGVDEGATFPDQLQGALRTSGLPKVVVHNGGVPGYTITDIDEQWREKLEGFGADWVILCHNGSDLKEMARPYSLRRMMRFDEMDPARDDADIRRLQDDAGSREAVIRTHFIFREQDLWQRLGQDVAKVEALRAAYIDGVRRFADTVRASGAKFAVILWVRRYTLGGIDVVPVRDQLRAAGIPVFEGEAAMHTQTEVPPGALYLPDRHFSPEGNRVAAQQSAGWLLKQLGWGSAKPIDSPRN